MDRNAKIREWLESYDPSSNHEDMANALCAVLDECERLMGAGQSGMNYSVGNNFSEVVAYHLDIEE